MGIQLRDQSVLASAADGPASSGSCPTCGNDLFTLEFGCPSCGYGKKPWLARNPVVVPAATFFVLTGCALGALATLGTVVDGNPFINGAIIVFGATFSAVGARILHRPEGVRVVPNGGVDAFGHQEWGASKTLTSDQATTTGAMFLVIGLAAIVLGVFFGELASGH